MNQDQINITDRPARSPVTATKPPPSGAATKRSAGGAFGLRCGS